MGAQLAAKPRIIFFEKRCTWSRNSRFNIAKKLQAKIGDFGVRVDTSREILDDGLVQGRQRYSCLWDRWKQHKHGSIFLSLFYCFSTALANSHLVATIHSNFYIHSEFLNKSIVNCRQYGYMATKRLEASHTLGKCFSESDTVNHCKNNGIR